MSLRKQEGRNIIERTVSRPTPSLVLRRIAVPTEEQVLCDPALYLAHLVVWIVVPTYAQVR